MTLIAKKQPSTYFYIVLLVLLFIAAPVPFVILAACLLFYWYAMAGNKKNKTWGWSFQDIDATLILMAWVFAMLSLGINHTADSVTQFGFPTTVITYYGYPTGGSLFSKLAINPAQVLANAVMYFTLLKLSQRLWRR